MANPLSRIPGLRSIDPAVATAFGCIILLLLIGAIINPSFLSPEYLLTQLQVASFLALMSTGMMLVILLGQIDLSLPWVITVGGMMSTAAAGWGPWGPVYAMPVGILCGVVFGLINGIGVAYLRVPSMIFTLGINAVAQGFMIVRTGGAAPQDMAPDSMHDLATGRFAFGLIPNPLWVWIVVGGLTVFLLRRTVFGRAIYAIGNREIAAYLSGISTQRVVLAVFAISGGLAAFAGTLLAGYSTKAYQGMGDPYLLPAIAAVVLGGTSILGGRGTYLGTVAGVILITLLQSILSVIQIEEAFRQLIYGAVIVAMLLLYGRGAKVTA
ncbi:MAG TPA: ABC transporter permease [Dongiaceae bacterium]|jgi:ribose transport system permease protein|nr:ABC transporter permease [Dongiaceae bacterium]